MDPIAALRAKQASGAVLSPLETAQLNGTYNQGANLQAGSQPVVQGTNAIPNTTYVPNPTDANPTGITQAVDKSNPSIPPTTAAPVATATGSNTRLINPNLTVGGNVFDVSTAAGAANYFNANRDKNLNLYTNQLNTLHNNLKNNTDSAKLTNESTLRDLNSNYNNIDQSARKYARGAATQAANEGNSFGSNLASIGSRYQSYSPGVFQSAQGDDTTFANANHERAVSSLKQDIHDTVGSNYIQGLDANGNLTYDNHYGDGSTYGVAFNKNAGAISDLGKQYDIYGTQQTQGEQDSEAVLRQKLNDGSDLAANTINSTNTYNHQAAFTPNIDAYKDPTVQPVNISQYTGDPITGQNLLSAQGSQPNYAPNAPVQDPKSQYLGYTPGTAQANYLTNFLKGVSS